MQSDNTTQKKGAGRPRRTDQPERFTVYLPKDAAAWALAKEGGLSATISSLLVRAMDKEQRIAAAAAAIENEED